jgi:hypothetical protein
MKKLFFILVTLILGFIFFEILSFSLLSLEQKKWFSRAEMLKRQESMIESSGYAASILNKQPDFMRLNILHPYIGFVLDKPNKKDQYGFQSLANPIQKKENGKIIMAITGGSVAQQIYDFSRDTLIQELKRHEYYRDKEFVEIRLAMGGFKQPQQLMTLNYLLSLGGEFDILINLDGFNESALPLAENIPEHVFPFFPRAWLWRVEPMMDAKMTALITAGTRTRILRAKLAKGFGLPLLRKSYTLNFLWQQIDVLLEQKVSKWNAEALDLNVTAKNYVASGPAQAHENNQALFQEIADVWKRSSLQMAHLAKANGIEYFHFLQPNQYFEGSKPLSPEEKQMAFRENHPYKKPVEDVYPYLVKAGQELEQADVAFKDLSMIFAENKEPLYVDACCHLNEKGYDYIAQDIAEFILTRMKK